MLDGGAGNLSASRLAQAQRVAQLIEEERHAVLDLRCCRWWDGSCGDLLPTSPDDLFTVERNELVQHDLAFSPCGPRLRSQRQISKAPTIDDQVDDGRLILNSCRPPEQRATREADRGPSQKACIFRRRHAECRFEPRVARAERRIGSRAQRSSP